MYAGAYTDSGHLTASRAGHNCLSWPHREQDASTNNNKRSVQGKSDTTGVIFKHPIRKKAQQDVGLFYYQNLIRIIRIMLILEFLQILTSYIIRLILYFLILFLKPHTVFLLPFETFLLSLDDF